ncbi:chemotaxis protein CheD [Ruminococcaceae bacterium OttesenSCG-928-O06]|nr:chemotaxis protein CheD [Ruminococcaceae bacterium OttesenSCG-928-O06]
MSNITIGISDLNVARPPDVLVTYALGSCVGICLYDQTVRVAGLSHVLLPKSGQIPGNNTPMKFADTAIPMLMVKMQALGARPVNLKAKIAGGAQMFASSSNASIANIGERNVQAVKATLQRLRIPIVAEDTGSNFGRTLLFSAEDFSMTIRSPKRAELKF